MNRDIIAQRLQRLARKRLVDAFGLLQADDVGLTLLQPGGEVVDALLDGIDVPGCDAHGGDGLKVSLEERTPKSDVNWHKQRLQPETTVPRARCASRYAYDRRSSSANQTENRGRGEGHREEPGRGGLARPAWNEKTDVAVGRRRGARGRGCVSRRREAALVPGGRGRAGATPPAVRTVPVEVATAAERTMFRCASMRSAR